MIKKEEQFKFIVYLIILILYLILGDDNVYKFSATAS